MAAATFYHHPGAHAFDQSDHLRNVVGVHLSGVDRPRRSAPRCGGTSPRCAGKRDFGKHPGKLRALMGHHLADAARADDQYFRHALRPSRNQSS